MLKKQIRKEASKHNSSHTGEEEKLVSGDSPAETKIELKDEQGLDGNGGVGSKKQRGMFQANWDRLWP